MTADRVDEARRVVLVSGDLLARARVEKAAGPGMTVQSISPEGLAEELEGGAADLVILDLDSGGQALLDQLPAAGDREGAPRAVGYFSHVDSDLGEAARRAGCEAFPRGRFWRELPELLARLPG